MTIWDRLAILDGACEHKWIRGARAEVWFETSVSWYWLYKCEKCGAELGREAEELLPLVGDGRNEERYNRIETLLRLAADLGLTVQITQFARGGLGRCLVKVWPQGKQEKGARVRDTLATVALANAILKAEEVPHA